MKKIYLLAGAFIFTAGAMAQNVNKLSAVKNNGFEARPAQNIDRAEGDEIWGDDFGTPGNWTFGNELGNGQEWVIGTNAPSGFYSDGMGAIASTTAGNGFAMYDSDAIGSGSTTQDAWVAWNGTGGTIVTTGIMAVTLEFESYYRRYDGNCYVEVSTDGGTTWPLANQFQVHTDVDVNNDSGNPALVRVNISSAAANQADVRIRFRYIGVWDYAWMVDDVKLIETYNNDLTLMNIGQRAGDDSVDVYMVPESQKTAFPGWYFGGEILNNGAMNQANTRLNVTTTGYNQDAPAVTLNSGVLDSFEIATPFSTTTDGDYELVFSAAMDNTDSETADNNDTMTVTVGGLLYARDNGFASGSISNVTSQPGQPLKIGNTFEVFADFNFTGIDLAISSSTLNENQTVSVEVQKYNATSQAFEYVTESEEITITAGMLGAFTTFALNDQVSASAGEYLLVLARHNGGVDLDSDGNPDEVAFLMAQNTVEGSVLGYTADGNSFQLTSPGALMIRINEDPLITPGGINEGNNNIASAVYPNPANDVTNINFTLTEAAQVSIEVVDINGKVVYTNNQGTLAAGNYTEVFNTSNLTNGIYYYNFNVNGAVTSNKLVVSHK